ncbi:hypothetical protein M9Y10_042133 [Tritrichomonas musculus]|uniref:Ras-GEF domain-containing protein n=1 Tax=Tritrichomonas musculus TaxID=1915356 RepID=A0ABR2K845_9EUKA
MNKPPIRLAANAKHNINLIVSDDSDYDSSYSSDIINVQGKAKIITRDIKLLEERPKSQREAQQKKNNLFFESKNIQLNSPIKSSASFLSDEENQCELNNRPPPFPTSMRPLNKVLRQLPQGKPDLRRNKEETNNNHPPEEQAAQEQHRKKKRKKTRNKNINQADINEKSSSVEDLQQQPPQQYPFPQSQPPRPNKQAQNPQPLPPQSPQQTPPQTSNPQAMQKLPPKSSLLYHRFPNTQDPRIQQQLQQRQLQQKQLQKQRNQIIQQKQNQPDIQQEQQQQQQQQKLMQNQRNQQVQQKQNQLEFQQMQESQNKQQQQQYQPQQKLAQTQRYQQLQPKQNQLGTQQLQEQQREPENSNEPPPAEPLSKTMPSRKRYNSSTEKNIANNNANIIDDFPKQNRISKDDNSLKRFPKPKYQNFTHNYHTDQTSNTTDTEITQEEDVIPRKRKKVKPKNKLSISEPSYLTFYYDSKEPIEVPQGDLVIMSNTRTVQPFSPLNHLSKKVIPTGRINNKIPPLPLSNVYVKQPAQTSRPPPAPKIIQLKEYRDQETKPYREIKTVTEEDEYIRSGTEYESEYSEIQLSKSSGANSSSGSQLNKTFMSAAVFNDLNETYNPTDEEQQQAFQDPLNLQNSTLSFHRVPTLSLFEQNASNKSNNQAEMMNNPQIAFSKFCFNIPSDSTTKESDNQEEDTTDYNNIELNAQNPVEELAEINENDDELQVEPSPWDDPNIPIKNSRVGKRPPSQRLTLQEMKIYTANKETKPEFKKLENNYRMIVDRKDQNVGTTMKPIDNLIEYKLTTTLQPNEDDITTFEQGGYYCLEKITPEAFIDFKFGIQITEPNPDHLHIFTWHNLGISQEEILKSLFNIVSKIEGNESDIPQIKSVIQYIFTWIYLFACDFYGNVEICSLLRKVLNITLEKSKPVDSHITVIANDICFLKACLDSLSQKNSTPENYSIPINKPSKLLNNYFRSMNLKELKVDPSILVKHFTYVELELFRKIDRSEIIKQASFKFENKEQKEKLLPNYTKYYVRFNSTAVFIAMSIMVKGSTNRAKRIEYWIKVMEEAKKFRNYFLLFEIDAALSCFPINRLEKTWKKISKRFITLFNGLHSITNPTSKAIIAYKKEVSKFPTKTMPYIGPFLTELRYIYEGKKLMMPMPNGKNGYNMKYQRAFCNVLEFIFQDWGTKIEFQIDNDLLEQCINLEGKEMKTEDLMPYSIQYEPNVNNNNCS